MRHIIAALALAVASCTPALAQSATPVLTVSTRLIDGTPGDGKIVLSSKRGPFAKGTAINAEPCPVNDLTPEFSYTRYGVACPDLSTPPTPEPSPPAPPPPPLVTTATLATVLGDEQFLQDDRLTVGIGRDGALGTRQAAPAGFRTDAAHGFVRVGIYSAKTELLLYGKAVEGFGLAYGGKRIGNFSRISIAQIPGAHLGIGRWQGRTSDGLSLDQRVTLADGLHFEVTLTNTGTTPITGLTYFRSIDLDTGLGAPLLTTTSTAAAHGWSSVMSDDRIVTLTSDDPRAFPAIDLRDPSLFRPETTSLARVLAGNIVKGDHTITLAFDVDPLAPGASVIIRFEIAVR